MSQAEQSAQEKLNVIKIDALERVVAIQRQLIYSLNNKAREAYGILQQARVGGIENNIIKIEIPFEHKDDSKITETYSQVLNTLTLAQDDELCHSTHSSDYDIEKCNEMHHLNDLLKKLK